MFARRRIVPEHGRAHERLADEVGSDAIPARTGL